MVRLGFPRVLSNTPRSQRRWPRHRVQKSKIKNLTLKEEQSPEHPFQSNQKGRLPTWTQIKQLTAERIQVVKDKGQSVTPVRLFLAILSLLSVRPANGSEVYWAYISDPTLAHPVTWEDPPIRVFTNNTVFFDSPDVSHVVPCTSPFNYTGTSSAIPICLSLVGHYGCVPLIQVTRKAYGFGVQESLGVQFFKHHQFIHHLSFPVSNHPQVTPLDGCFPVCKENPMPWFQNGIPPWVACSTVLKNSVPLNGRPEVLVDLSWRRPPGLDEEDFLGPPHWPRPVIMSPEGKVQPDLWLLATAMDNVVVYGIFGENKQLWRGHRFTFGLTACVNPPYMLLTGSPSIQESEGQFKITCINCLLSNCVNSSSHESLLLLQQPSFVRVPVHFKYAWYGDFRHDHLEQHQGFIRKWRFLGQNSSSIFAVVNAIQPTAVSTVALAQQLQTAHFFK